MDLKILAVILVYYTILSSFFLMGAGYLSDATLTGSVNSSNTLAPGETDLGGLFGSGISFTRFVGFVGFGLGLPSDTPAFFSTIFIFIQSAITIFTIGFIISSIWNG